MGFAPLCMLWEDFNWCFYLPSAPAWVGTRFQWRFGSGLLLPLLHCWAAVSTGGGAPCRAPGGGCTCWNTTCTRAAMLLHLGVLGLLGGRPAHLFCIFLEVGLGTPHSACHAMPAPPAWACLPMPAPSTYTFWMMENTTISPFCSFLVGIQSVLFYSSYFPGISNSFRSVVIHSFHSLPCHAPWGREG